MVYNLYNIMVLWFVTLLTTSFIYRVHTEPLCRMQDMKIICNSQEQTDVTSNIVVSIADKDILDLTVVNKFIPVIDKETYSNYTNLHTLTLNNTKTAIIKKESFKNLNLLRNVYLSNNYLTEFNSNIFSASHNALTRLDISNNLIEDLSNFNISIFNSLTLMNISYNRLTFLPELILEKLEEENNIYLIIDYNPWNCSHPNWIERLNSSPLLTQAFCIDSNNNISFEFVDKILQLSNLSYYEIGNITNLNLSNNTETVSTCSFKHCFTHCIFWSIGSVWVGIILGNMCKIKRLICFPERLEDRSTQYGQLNTIKHTNSNTINDKENI